MGKARALSLIAEGKTGDALNHLFAIVSVYETTTNGNEAHQISDAYSQLVYISSRFHKVESVFMEGYINFGDYEIVVNKITLSLIKYVRELNSN